MVFKDEEIRAEAVRIARQLYAEGKTTQEIMRIMCLSESQVRSLKATIDESENTN